MFLQKIPVRFYMRRNPDGSTKVNNRSSKETMWFNTSHIISISEHYDHYLMTVSSWVYVDYYKIDKEDILFNEYGVQFDSDQITFKTKDGE